MASRATGSQQTGNELARRQASQGRLGSLGAGVALAVVVLMLPLAASAAELIEVRVGRHPSFTRVVFELDAPAGYKVERNSPGPGISELVVSLDASAGEQKISASQSYIEGVEIEPSGDNAVARIRLAREGLQLKEMILSKPPRIVLDLVGPEAKAPPVAAAKPKPAPPSPAADPKPNPDAASDPVAAPSPAVTVTKPALTVKPVIVARTAPSPKPTTVARSPEAAPAVAQPPKRPTAPAARPTIHRELPSESATPAVRRPKTTPSPAARKAAAPPAKPVAKPPPASRSQVASDESSFGTTTLVATGIGIVALAGAAFFMMRRRGTRPATQMDENPLGEENPFAGIDSDGVSTQESAVAVDSSGAPSPETGPLFETTTSDLSSLTDDAMQAPGGVASFDASPNASPEGPEGISMQPNTSESHDFAGTDAFAVPPAGAAASPDATRLVRELERRLANLETRLDESVDARERLERQVAAQTEELRVQRAAIARTQRAVRSMTRTEEDASPTEPALRDPAAPPEA